MGLRERLLESMDRYQRILLVCVIGLSLVLQISTELTVLHYYQIRGLHLVMLFALVLVLLNPKRTRLVLFCFFTFLLIDLLRGGSFHESTLIYALSSCFYGLPLMWLGVSIKWIIYIHLGLYAVLAYFSFKNPFKPNDKMDSRVLDDW